jgi:hypothetical protein
MIHFPFLFELSPLYLAQGALTVWMLIDANRRGVEGWWFWAILVFQPFGAWAYFFLYKVKDFTSGSGWLAGLFQRRASVSELRHLVERSPTAANRLELGARLVDDGAFEEALPHLQAMLAREPEHCRALFAAARAQRGLGHPDQAVPLLQKLVKHQPGWGDYTAWRLLVEVSHEAGDQAGTLTQSRELARLAPSLQHRCLLAEHLLDAGEAVEARKVLELGLDDYRYLSGPSRRRERRWVGKAKELLDKAG